MSVSQLKSVARLPLPQLSSKAAKLFRTPLAQVRLVSRLRAKIQPTRIVSKSSLRGTDARLGMRLTSVTPGDYQTFEDILNVQFLKYYQ